jgi:hypothetical protein
MIVYYISKNGGKHAPKRLVKKPAKVAPNAEEYANIAYQVD